MYNNNCQCISDELRVDPNGIQSPKAYMGYPWVIIYEHRAVVCAYVYDFSLNKQTNKQTYLDNMDINALSYSFYFQGGFYPFLISIFWLPVDILWNLCANRCHSQIHTYKLTHN